MRKLLILIGLCLTLSLSGQLLPGVVASQGGATGGYCAQYQAVYDRMDALGNVPNATNAGYQNAMVQSLVSAGYWARLLYLIVPATEVNEAGQALIWWHNPAVSASYTNTLNWTTQSGYVADNGSGKITTGFNSNTPEQNNVTFGIYNRVDAQDAGYIVYATATYYWVLRVRDASDKAETWLNAGGGAGIANVTSTDARGLWISTRRGSNEVELYKNGSSVGSDTDASTGEPDYNIVLMSGTPWGCSIFFIMDAVSDAEALELSNIFNTYMTAIGTNTY